MPVRSVPMTASVASDQDGRLFAPSAARNTDAICAKLCGLVQQSGTALEIASGTGQHVIAFATAMPHVDWQPSEVDAIRRRSIDAYVAECALSNVRAAIHLDATAADWQSEVASYDLITLCNLLHLVSKAEAHTLISEAAKAMRENGRFVIYGPFRRNGVLTSGGDQRFDESLRNHDPEIGYKDLTEIADFALQAGVELSLIEEMPANNLMLHLTRKR
ncbi:MAG: DUF938 domain-containing protein [Paracoccaceae bacterium]